jgi:hypothetical protein
VGSDAKISGISACLYPASSDDALMLTLSEGFASPSGGKAALRPRRDMQEVISRNNMSLRSVLALDNHRQPDMCCVAHLPSSSFRKGAQSPSDGKHAGD